MSFAFLDSDAPSLAAAYAVHLDAGTLLQDEPVWAGPTPTSTIDWQADDGARRFRNLQRTGWIGLGVAAGGAFGIAIFGLGAAACSFNGDPCAIPMAGMVLVSGIAFLAGDVLFHYGGIAAAYKGRHLGLDVSPVVGWVGVGLVGAGVVLSQAAGTGEDPNEALSGLSTAMALGALGCGIGQLAVDGHAGRAGRIGIAITPTPSGLLVAGRF